jgi:hypothetical protein
VANGFFVIIDSAGPQIDAELLKETLGIGWQLPSDP